MSASLMVMADTALVRQTSPGLSRPLPRTASKAHLVGVCGTGMKALAELLTGQGWRVTGSDLAPSTAALERLASRGLRVHQGHHGRHVPDDAEVLVYSPAVEPSNPERLWAASRGLPQFSYSQMLGWLMQDRVGVCVAGTHGKSTTTAMTGCILTEAGLAPSVVLGAELREYNASGWAGAGPAFVVESCEFQRSFLDLHPRHAAILSVEPDHFDCYKQFDETIAAFAAFAQRVPATGSLLVSETCQAAQAACTGARAPVETFALRPTADWWAADLRPTRDGTRFRVFHHGEYVTEISLRIPGEHNVLNALAAAALSLRLGASPAAIREGLAQFAGLKRRFEPVGSWRGVTLIDDYAHHPTAVAATLRAARDAFPQRRLWCVFQPHQVSRTCALIDDFASSFAAADQTLVVPVYAAREQVTSEPADVSARLAVLAAARGAQVRFAASLDHALQTLDHDLRPGDVLITMGAGDVGQVHHAFTRRLQRHHGS